VAEPRRRWSLRSRVAIAAALGAVVVAVVVAAVVAGLLTRREVAALDRRLDLATAVLRPRIAAGADPEQLLAGDRGAGLGRAAVGGLVVTVRTPDGGTRTAGFRRAVPVLPASDGDASVDGTGYRVRTVTLRGGGTLTVGLTEAATDRTVAQLRRVTVLVTALAALAAAGLGWLLAGPATRPLRTLRDRTAAAGPPARTGPPWAPASSPAPPRPPISPRRSPACWRGSSSRGRRASAHWPRPATSPPPPSTSCARR
jgi:two-component system sensor histidine kinase PrrB